MSGGTFKTKTTTVAGQKYSRYIYCNWSSVNDTENNTSTISWEVLSGSENTNTNTGATMRPGKNTSTDKAVFGIVSLTINDQVVYTSGNDEISLYKNTLISSGEITVSHDPNGTKNVDVSIEATLYSSGKNTSSPYVGMIGKRSSESINYIGSITMTANPVFDLAINSNQSDIIITRTYCAGSGNTGTISSGSNVLCYGDIISVSASGIDGYVVRGITINDIEFTNGNNYTVTGDISVVALTNYAPSTVSATDTYMNFNSIVSIRKPNVAGYSYSHVLKYEFGSLTGYINGNGEAQDSSCIISETRIEFKIPDIFYSQIPDSLKGTCKITCTTYVCLPNSPTGTMISDSTTCVFAIWVDGDDDDCKPSIRAGVVDGNYSAARLTGSNAFTSNPENKFIRYRSQYLLEVEAWPQKYSSIKKIIINGKQYEPSIINESGYVGLQESFDPNNNSTFEVKVFDSRGISRTTTITPTVVDYAILTFNPIVERKSPTSSEITLACTGTFYEGNFGAFDNQLYIEYRYKQSDTELWSEWANIDTSEIIFADGQYRTPTGGLLLGDDFSYKNTYDFEFYVRDGNDGVGVVDNVEHYILTEITKTSIVYKGIPTFDWGENDFKFNVPLYINYETQATYGHIPIKINNKLLMDCIIDLIYPVGSIYVTTASEPPLYITKVWGKNYSKVDIGNGLSGFQRTGEL